MTDASNSDGRRERSSVAGTILFLLAAPILWSLHLLLIYGPQSSLCAFATAEFGYVSAKISWIVIGVTFVVLALLSTLFLRMHQVAALLRVRTGELLEAEFAISVARYLTVLSLLGVAWAGATALLLDACSQLR